MSSVQSMVHWFTQNPFWGATASYGLAHVAVTLYTCAHDYLMLAGQK